MTCGIKCETDSGCLSIIYLFRKVYLEKSSRVFMRTTHYSIFGVEQDTVKIGIALVLPM